MDTLSGETTFQSDFVSLLKNSLLQKKKWDTVKFQWQNTDGSFTMDNSNSFLSLDSSK